MPKGVATQSMREYSVLNIAPSGFTSGLDRQSVERMSDQLSESELRLVDQYCESIKRSQTLKAHVRMSSEFRFYSNLVYLKLDDVEKDLEEYAYLVKTQAVAELTFFRGMRSWAQARPHVFQLVAELTSTDV